MSDQLTLSEFMQEIGVQSGNKSMLSDIKNVISALMDRQNIDMSTRIRDNELDKICAMLHHSHQYSIVYTKHMQEHYKNELTYMCSAESYILQNLSLRLSLDSESRKELVSVFTSLIQTEVQIQKAEQQQELKEQESK